MINYFEKLRMRQNDVLYREGDKAKFIYIIQEGEFGKTVKLDI